MTLYGFKQREHAESLKKIAAEYRRSGVTSINPAGLESRVVQVSEELEAFDPENSQGSIPTAQATIMNLGDPASPVLSEQQSVGGDVKCNIVNLSTDTVEANKPFTVHRIDEHWVHLTGSSSSSTKRVKFILTRNILESGVDMSGFATATVIDPLNSELTIGAQIIVWDYQHRFPLALEGAIGMAYYGDPFNPSQGLQWHIEFVEQLVNKVKVMLRESVSPWEDGNAVEGSITSALSTWPYNMFDSNTTLGGTIVMENNHRFTANIGTAIAELIIPEAYQPQPGNNVAPYTLAPLTPTWNITDVQYPTARWCATNWDGDDFKLLTGGTNYAEGEDPGNHSEFSSGMTANPPEHVWSGMQEFRCNINDGTTGWAFLDDNTGKYVTVMTESALFGKPTVVEAVMRMDSNSEEMIRKDDAECGRIRYESLRNVLVWGNEQGSSGCKLEEVAPDKYFDLFTEQTVTVVTGTEIFNGELRFTTAEIKACYNTGAALEIPHVQTDIVTDVSCTDDGLSKSYKTIKFIGSTVASNQGVNLPCTNPDNFDWQYIFENHVYPEDWWNVDYYDITFPEGCEPCPDPVGCCTADAYPDGQDGITQSDCEAETGFVSWTEGSCDECSGSQCCCGNFAAVNVSLNCPPGPGGVGPGIPGGSSNVSWEFNSIGGVDGDGSCNWAVVGVWTITDSNNNTNDVSGTVNISHQGNGAFTGSGTVDGNSFTLSSNGNATWDGNTPCSNVGSWTYTFDEELACQNQA